MVACLTDPSRFRVVNLLLEGNYCVSEVARRVGLSQSCTTRHLQSLQRAGVLSRTRAGKRVLFRIREGDPELDRVLELMVLRRPLESHAGTPSPESAGRSRGHEAPASTGPRTSASESFAGGRVADALTIHAATSRVTTADAPAVPDSATEGKVGPEHVAEPVQTAVAELEDYLL